MSVKAKSTTIQEVENLSLTLDNGDRENFKKCLNEWNFKDEQSLVRFVLSVLIESEDKRTIGIRKVGGLGEEFSPANHLLKNTDGQ